MNDPDTNDIPAALKLYDKTTEAPDSSPPNPDFKVGAITALLDSSEIFAPARQGVVSEHAAPASKENVRPARQKHTDRHTAFQEPNHQVAAVGRLLSEIIEEIPVEERRYVLENYQEGIRQGSIKAVELRDGSGEYISLKVYYYGDQGRTRRTLRDEYVITTEQQQEWTRLQRTASRQHRMHQTGKVWAVLSDVREGSVDIELLAEIRRETAQRDAGLTQKRRRKS